MTDRPGVVVPPPLIYFAGLAAGYVAGRWLPVPWFARIGHGIGYALVLAGLALALWAASLMLRARTHILPHAPTTVLVTSGPFRISRNPLYVSLTLVYTGLAIAHAALALPLLPLVIAAMQWLVISREERYLEAKFGDVYREYKRSVRRWV
jgi:protein-S-isoprenylcysteine O-methyltransferase Ste14